MTERTDWALVGIGALQALIFFAQLRVFKTQAQRLRETIESTEKSERAYLFCEVNLERFQGVMGRDEHNRFGTVRATAKFWNYGKTPAIVTNIRGYITVDGPPPRELVPIEGTEWELRQLPPGLGIAPNVAHEVVLERELSIDEFAEVLRLEKHVFFVGRIDYRDINHRQCTTGFCWQLERRDSESFVTVTRDSDLNRQT